VKAAAYVGIAISAAAAVATGGPGVGGASTVQRLSQSREVQKQLRNVIPTLKGRLTQVGGWDVYAVIKHEICVKGFFNSYWKKCGPKVVRLPPTDSSLTHLGIAGSEATAGWRTDLVEDAKKVAAQLPEWIKQAVNICRAQTTC
jgi:hypothetical protein